jgi:hypothetical protein
VMKSQSVTNAWRAGPSRPADAGASGSCRAAGDDERGGSGGQEQTRTHVPPPSRARFTTRHPPLGAGVTCGGPGQHHDGWERERAARRGTSTGCRAAHGRRRSPDPVTLVTASCSAVAMGSHRPVLGRGGARPRVASAARAVTCAAAPTPPAATGSS